jgi:hypothetical protein
MLVIDLFRWLILSWFNFGWINASGNLVISRFSNLLEYKFSMYFLMTLWISYIFVVMPSVSSLILSCWVFSFLFLVRLGKGLLILLIFFEEPTFCFVDSCKVFFSISLISVHTINHWKEKLKTLEDGKISILVEWQNQSCESGCTTKSNLYVQYNSYQNSKDILTEIEKSIIKFIYKHKRPC